MNKAQNQRHNPHEQNTLECLITKKPLGHILYISHPPEEGRVIETDIINGTIVILYDR